MFFDIIIPTWFMRPSDTKIKHLRNHCSPNEQFDGLVELFIDCVRNMGNIRLRYSTVTAFLYALSKIDVICVAEYIIRGKLYNGPQPIQRVATIVLMYWLLYFITILNINIYSKDLRGTAPAWVHVLEKIILSDGRMKHSRGINSCKVLLDILSEHLPELSRECPWLESIIDLLQQILNAKSIDAIFDLPKKV